MNKTKNITIDNIDETELLMKRIWCYFTCWKKKAVESSKYANGK